MIDGFIKVAAASPKLLVADTKYNTERIAELITKADKDSVNLLVFPELCITGYTCADLFRSDALLSGAIDSLKRIRDLTKDKYPAVVVGLPIRHGAGLYNCAAVVKDGAILGIVPKQYIFKPTEKRQFESGRDLFVRLPELDDCLLSPCQVFDVFVDAPGNGYTFGIEIGSDSDATDPPSRALCETGATIILTPAASEETALSAKSRQSSILSLSKRYECGYVYASAGTEESTTDSVFSGHRIISECGDLLREAKPFECDDYTVSEIDVGHIRAERTASGRYHAQDHTPDLVTVCLSQERRITSLTRAVKSNPFLPNDEKMIPALCEEALNIQAYALKKRIECSYSKTAVIGISGGLDSTLALLVMARAMDLLGRSRKDIVAVTMPGFGTTGRTKSNAVMLCEELGVTLREISIENSVRVHFADIGHDENDRNVVYENSQARERTQILMDVANQLSGIVVGTGDLSELALGWATYNGDHMSMYGVNASVPKTLIRHIVRYEAERLGGTVRDILISVIDTPVSPELLPADGKGNIKQITEDLVGPYELHDFFIYYTVKFGFTPSKIFRLAAYAFGGEYSNETILKWLKTFVRRFFNQQFKRSCLPDGPAVTDISLSPRGGFAMPSDAVSRIWIEDAESIEI